MLGTARGLLSLFAARERLRGPRPPLFAAVASWIWLATGAHGPRAPVFGRSGEYGCAWRDAQQILLRAAVCDAGCYFVFVDRQARKCRPARFSESSEKRVRMPCAALNGVDSPVAERLRKTICL